MCSLSKTSEGTFLRCIDTNICSNLDMSGAFGVTLKSRNPSTSQCSLLTCKWILAGPQGPYTKTQLSLLVPWDRAETGK